MSRNRLPYAQREILAVLKTRPEISYNDIAAETLLARGHVITSVRTLEARRRIAVQRGIGGTNRYSILEG